MEAEMTRKHFKALAARIKWLRDGINLQPWQHEALAAELADFCRQQNDLFDREKFLAACGVIKTV